MKSQIIKLVALITLLSGNFAISAQNNRTSSAFAIDKNIISFEVANLVDKVITEHPSQNNYRTPEGISPHFWTIKLIMAEGTDVTSLSPTITLAPGASITSRHAAIQDFSKQVDYTVIAEDGSTVTYTFLACTQEKTRAWSATFQSKPESGGTVDDIYNIDDTWFCKAYPNSPMFYFSHWEVFIYSNSATY